MPTTCRRCTPRVRKEKEHTMLSLSSLKRRRLILMMRIFISFVFFVFFTAEVSGINGANTDSDSDSNSNIDAVPVVQETTNAPLAPGPNEPLEYPVKVMGTSDYDQLPDKKRCRWLESGPDFWVSSADSDSSSSSSTNTNTNTNMNTLDNMFRRIVRMYESDEKYKSKLNIASSPDNMPSKIYSDYSSPGDIEVENDDDDDEHYTPDDNPYELHGGDGGPWLLVIDDFLDTGEVNRLIELGEWEGYERSTLIEDEDDDDDTIGDSDEKADRTSSTAWCQSRTCKNDEISQDVIDRIYELVQFDDLHAEDLQLLHYEVGQYYLPHHDFYYIDDIDEWNQDGGRILTVFLYLNDVVDGGGTNFPRLNITVTPKLGRVVIWPSVLDNNPRKIDWRTEHEALPVKDGVKYGANLWFHLKPSRKSYFNYECDKSKNNTNGSTRNMHHYDDDDDDDDYDVDKFDGFDDDDKFYEEEEDEDQNLMFEKYGLHLDEDDDVAKEL